jgi:hypothetical protein
MVLRDYLLLGIIEQTLELAFQTMSLSADAFVLIIMFKLQRTSPALPSKKLCL